MRTYADAWKRKKGLVYTASLASLMPVKAAEKLNLTIPPEFKAEDLPLSRATIYLHPFYTTRRKRGPGKSRTIGKEYRAQQVVHYWLDELAEEIYDAMFHPFKGTRTHLLKTKTSNEIAEWYLARKRP